MSTTITYEGTMPGSRMQGEVVERHSDGSVTVVHPDGSPWRYTVRPEHIIVDEATPTAAEPDTFRTVLLRTALDLGAADPNPAFTALLQQMGNLAWMPLDAREQFDAMLRANFTGSINEAEVQHADWCHTVLGCTEPGHCTCDAEEAYL